NSTMRSVPPASGRSSGSPARSASACDRPRGRSSPCAAASPRIHYRLEDARVAGAAAEVAGERRADVGLGRVRRPLEQAHRREHHARRADAALRAAVLEEGLLDLGEPALVGEPLDGADVRAGRLTDRDQAAADQLAVEEDGAGAALALGAALLGA